MGAVKFLQEVALNRKRDKENLYCSSFKRKNLMIGKSKGLVLQRAAAKYFVE